MTSRIAYLTLIKHRLSLAVTFSAIAGTFIYKTAGARAMLATALGVFLLAAGTSALNQYQERQRDALMKRTRERPIPTGQISAPTALWIAISHIVLGTIVLFIISPVPAFLGLLNVFFYNAIYTPLKTRTTFSIVPGAIVGAVPPLIGWTVAGGNVFDPTIMFIACFMFMWQIPHFWLLAIKWGDEYTKAGFSCMTQSLHKSQITRLLFFWAALTSLFLFSFYFFGIISNLAMGIVFISMNLGFIYLFYYILFKKESEKRYGYAFGAINLFMMTVLLLVMIDIRIFG